MSYNIIRGVLLSLLLAGFLAGPCSSQETGWDSTYRPPEYASRLEELWSQPHSSKDIVFLGNSITYYTKWAELLNSPHAKNKGISGDISFGVLGRLDEVIEGQPAKVFILIGINDLARNVPVDVILQNYQRIISRIRSGSPSTRIYFQTLLPTNINFRKAYRHYNVGEQILQVNEGLKELSEKQDIVLIDLYDQFADEKNQLKTAYTYDGVHLSDEGKEKWVEILKRGKYLRRYR
jgi:lysophospholipase L1-like esterase